MKKLRSLLLTGATLLIISCGYKGDLYLPEPTPADESTAADNTQNH